MPFSNAFLRFLPAQKPQTQGFFLLPSRLIFSLCPALNASFIFSYLPWPLLKLRSWLQPGLQPENQSKTLPFYLLFVLSKNQKPIGLFVKQKKQLVFNAYSAAPGLLPRWFRSLRSGQSGHTQSILNQASFASSFRPFLGLFFVLLRCDVVRDLLIPECRQIHQRHLLTVVGQPGIHGVKVHQFPSVCGGACSFHISQLLSKKGKFSRFCRIFTPYLFSRIRSLLGNCTPFQPGGSAIISAGRSFPADGPKTVSAIALL